MVRWRPPREETLQRAAELGLHPRAARFGQIRIVGVYEVPFFPEVVVLEAIVRRPWWMVDLEEWHPYQPPAWSEEWGVGLADFYLDEEGRQLVGSYLAAPPIAPITRFAIVSRDGELPALIQRRRLRVPPVTPIPERLLRLIWLEA